MADLEERFFAKGSNPNRLEAMERHILQLTQQMAHLAIMVSERSITQPPTTSAPAVEVLNTSYMSSSPEEVDPVISRLSQFLDDF